MGAVFCASIPFLGLSDQRRVLAGFVPGKARSNRMNWARMCAASSDCFPCETPKRVWMWTKNKEVMTSAVERGWNTFLFLSQDRELAIEWSSMAMIQPVFLEEDSLIDCNNRKVGAYAEISNPQELLRLQAGFTQTDNIVVNFLDWQIIPAENVVAAFQNRASMVLAISRTVSEAKAFLEALEHGLNGVVLQVEDTTAVFELKDYLDRRDESSNVLGLSKAVVSRIEAVGMGDRVCVDLCSVMRPGEGLLVGSFARGLFLVHSECLESNYIASRPFRVNAGPVHSYVAVPGGKTAYLSELKAGKEVVVSDQNGKIRTAVVGRVKVETRALIMVTAKMDAEDETEYTAFLQNAETVALVPSCGGVDVCCADEGRGKTAIPVTSLKVGDEVLLRVQGGARHTGIEIQEFIVEK